MYIHMLLKRAVSAESSMGIAELSMEYQGREDR